jgi:hypothetical protein
MSDTTGGLFARMLLANCILILALGFFLVHEFPLNQRRVWHLAVSRYSGNTDRFAVCTASLNAGGLRAIRE